MATDIPAGEERQRACATGLCFRYLGSEDDPLVTDAGVQT